MGMAKRGFFLVLEGGEGCGKSTQVDSLSLWCRNQGLSVVKTREPGGTPVGQRIREILLDPKVKNMGPRTEALLYQADRAQHVEEVIRPALKQGKVVISDRFGLSSAVYQGICRGVGFGRVQLLNRFSTEGLSPDLVIILDLPVDLSRQRMKGRKLDRLEREKGAFHYKVRSGFLRLAKKRGVFKLIDGTKPPEVVLDSILQALIPKLRRRGFRIA